MKVLQMKLGRFKNNKPDLLHFDLLQPVLIIALQPRELVTMKEAPSTVVPGERNKGGEYKLFYLTGVGSCLLF